jgi:hypothetical protein
MSGSLSTNGSPSQDPGDLSQGIPLASPDLVIIDTSEIKEKLINLQNDLPNLPSNVHKFAKLLAERLNPRINSVGFVVETQLLIYDIQTGVNGYNGEAMVCDIEGFNPEEIYTSFAEITRNVSSDKFAEQACIFLKPSIDQEINDASDPLLAGASFVREQGTDKILYIDNITLPGVWETFEAYDRNLGLHFAAWTYPSYVKISWNTLNESIKAHSEENPDDGEYNEESLASSRQTLESCSIIKPSVKQSRSGLVTTSYSIHQVVGGFLIEKLDKYGENSLIP